MGKGLPVDLAHTSDKLAHDLLNYIDAHSLDIPVIASHSNFRSIWAHVRNLPGELVKEVVRRKGLIGMNFLRLYIHESDPDFLIRHISFGLKTEVALEQLAFGADFFYRPALEGPERSPLFFPEHEDAGKYPFILEELARQGAAATTLAKLSYQNVLDFISRNW